MTETTFRMASENDCALIIMFIKQLAEYENLYDLVVTDEEELKKQLFIGHPG